jgi:transposase
MIKRGWSAEDVTALRYGRFQHPDPRVHVRMEALYVRSQGVTKGEIRRLWRLSSASFPRDLKAYVAGGVEPRKRSDHDRPPRELAHDRTTREADLPQHPPATVAEAAAPIAAVTGMVCQPTHVRQWLRALGMKPRHVGMIPAKADVDAQEACKKKPGAKVTGSWRWPAPRVVHGCGPLCVRPLLRPRLVLPAALCQSPRGAPAGEGMSGPEGEHTRGVDGPAADREYRRDGV